VRPAVTHLKKLDDRSVSVVYFGVESGSKAHRMYNPNTGKIVVSRDVVFEETTAWRWESEISESSEFVVENDWGEVSQPHDNHQLTDGGDVQPTVDNTQADEGENSRAAATDQEPDEIVLEDTVDQDEDVPVKYRSINDIYQDSEEVELPSGTDVEAMLAVMEEPANFQDAVANENWVAAMDSEIQSISKNQTWQTSWMKTYRAEVGIQTEEKCKG
jgi:hypothetical protein